MKPLLSMTLLLLAALLAACSTSKTKSGGTSDMALSNDAINAKAPQDGGLARCDERAGSTALGSLAITEADGNAQALSSANLPRSMAPLVRHMLSRTRCFVVVDRGAAFTLLEQERKLRSQQSTEGAAPLKNLRTADYVMRAEIVFAEQTEGGKGLLGGIFGNVIGGVGGQYNKKEAVVLLSVVDARTSEIVSSVFGRGTSESAGLGSLVLSSGGALVDGGWADTPQAKTVAAALVDAWNRTLPRLQAAAVPAAPGAAAASAPSP
jgi:curli biogenesis system outer membrane secretion channel CsgG